MPIKTTLKDKELHLRTKLATGKPRSGRSGDESLDSKRLGMGRIKKGNGGGDVDTVNRIKLSSGKWSSKLRRKDGEEGGDYRNERVTSNTEKRSSKLRGKDEGGGDYRNEKVTSSTVKRSSKLKEKDEGADYRKGRVTSRCVKRGSELRRKGEEEGGDYSNERVTLSTGKRNSLLRMKDKSKEVGHDYGELKLGNLNKKRKRVYADRCLDNVEIPNVNKQTGNALKGKRTAIAHNSEQFDRTAIVRQRKSEASEIVDRKKSRGLSKLTTKDKVEDANVDGVLRKSSKGIYERRKQLDQDQSIRVADILKRSTKKKVQGKKNTGDDAEETEQKPKKKKRVIRIDPYDTSNKRLDDGLADDEEKRKDLPITTNVEMSKNAQFRAIVPSPSILSFVEDNLLGRRREIEIKRAGYNIELSAPLDNIPFSTSSERERIEEPAFRNKLSFFAAAKVSSSFPPPDLPEIAFAGRSNVGKSSLLNSLTRQWGVVRTSDKPGHTQTINFFNLGAKLCLVDLPGYGFAHAKEEVKEAWEELVKEYVSSRVGLKRVCLLVDTKWGMKPRDYELVDLMERSRTKYQIVLTKTDLVFPLDVARRAMQIEESMKQNKSAVQPVMMVSSKSGAGVRTLRTVLSKISRFIKP